MFLNETGDHRLDRLTIEFNGILADRRVKANVWRACLDFLVEQVPDWDALYLSGVGVDDYQQLAASEHGLSVDITDRKPSPYADLRRIRQTGEGLFSTLSRNTRYQVRRAMRDYEMRGSLELRAAETVQEALGFLSGLKTLHQAYWMGRGEDGAFANAYFETFHHRLISEHFDDRSVELLRISTGSKIVGYLYNFRRAKWYYNYQSGFNYETDRKLKPGLISHCLAMLRYLDRDAIAYDFMAGDSQYKHSLSNAQRQLVWMVVRKDLLKHHIEDACRRIYHVGVRKGTSTD